MDYIVAKLIMPDHFMTVADGHRQCSIATTTSKAQTDFLPRRMREPVVGTSDEDADGL